MKQLTFPEEQITYVLRQVEMGTPVADVCRRLGMSEQTCSRWKRTFAGMGAAELRQLRQLEEKNRKLKPLVADLMLDQHMLQEVLRKKLQNPLSAGSWCRVCGWPSRSGGAGNRASPAGPCRGAPP